MGIRLFSIGDIPVSVSPWYLLLFAFWLHGDIVGGLIWAGVVTVSILVHELGHALVARYFRLQPKILLWGLGGLCFHDRAERDRHDALIIAAGPGAGLLLGALTFVVALVLPPTSFRGMQVVQLMLYVNIIWSFVNLLPLWPLDGGQLFRLGLLQFVKPALADKITHGVSLPLLVIGAVLALHWQSIFLGLLVAFGIWQNVRALRGDISSGAVRPSASKEAKPLLKAARQAFDAGDYREAARICHNIRDIDHVADATMRESWVLLGAATARLGDHASALRYLERAPDDPLAVEAKVECLYQLDRMDELDDLLASKAFKKLPETRRAEILAVVRRG